MMECDAQAVASKVVDVLRHRKVPIGISNRHVHLSERDFEQLFPGQSLTVDKPLLQPGHFAATQTVTLKGPKGVLNNVRILGPLRPNTQVEVSATQARELGIKAPVRMSGELEGSPGIQIISNFAEVTLEQGVIVANRHIHMNSFDALLFGVDDCQRIDVLVGEPPRTVLFKNVVIRVDPQLVLEMHLDTDEANAAGLTGMKDTGQIMLGSKG
ncbi:propanediol utilization protein [Photobacterium gaetbulicola]|uniref:Phosphate propanoyltransferase n=1 Tax=Photobacterium gaetbulicola TaxID=1295392 RepID=A0A0B9H667_9GAMM|nr:phosphate propanoyltransferase [Photobacterium gaetbulicola]KHT64392.1 propanediol utilization protein [Photobacterium gaetbulicola]